MSCCNPTKNSCSYLDVTFENDTEEQLTLFVYDLQAKGEKISPTIIQPLASFTKTFEQKDDVIESLVMDTIVDILAIVSLVADPGVMEIVGADLAMLQTYKDSVDWDNVKGAGCFGNILYTTNVKGKCKTYISYFSCIQNYCLAEGGNINTFITNFYYYDGINEPEVLKKFNTKDICIKYGSYDNNSGCVKMKIINENEICKPGGFNWNNGLSFCDIDSSHQCWEDLVKSKKLYKDGTGGWWPSYSFNKFIDCQKKVSNGQCYQAFKQNNLYFKVKPCQYNCAVLYKNQDICDPSLTGVGCFDENAPGKCQAGLCPVKQYDGSYKCNEKKTGTNCDYSITNCAPIKYEGTITDFNILQRNTGVYTPIDRYHSLENARKDCSENNFCQGVVQDNKLGYISTATRIFMDENKISPGDDPYSPKRYNIFLKS